MDKYIQTYSHSIRSLKGKKNTRRYIPQLKCYHLVFLQNSEEGLKLRREEWERGFKTRSSQQEMVPDHVPNIERFSVRMIMHYNIFHKEGHKKNKCPDKQIMNEKWRCHGRQ